MPIESQRTLRNHISGGECRRRKRTRSVSGMFDGRGGPVIPIYERVRRWRHPLCVRSAEQPRPSRAWDGAPAYRVGWRVSVASLALGIVPCVLPCLSVQSAAQTATVSGVVRDASGAVLVGAVLHAQSGSWQASGWSNASGRFSFANVPAGTGTLDVVAQGFVAVH